MRSGQGHPRYVDSTALTDGPPTISVVGVTFEYITCARCDGVGLIPPNTGADFWDNYWKEYQEN